MNKEQELELFDHLSRTRLRDWLKKEEAILLEVLKVSPDIEKLRQAQGQAQILSKMEKLLDAAPGAVKR